MRGRLSILLMAKSALIKLLFCKPRGCLQTCAVLVIAALLGSVSAAAAEDETESDNLLAVDNFSATIWLTTDSVDRGISNTDEGPAVQASLDWGYNGFYLGVWGSNTRYSDAGIEIDYYGGYNWEWHGVSFDAGALYYNYPGEDANRSDGLDPDGGQEADYWETSFAVSHTFDGWLTPVAAVTYFYSPDFFGEDGDAHALKGDLKLSLPYEFVLGVETGYQDVAGGKLSTGYDYLWWRIGVSRVWAGFNLDLSYHEVDDKLEACDVDLCDARAVFTVSREF